MLSRVIFMLERGSNRLYTHFIEFDGLIVVAVPLDKCQVARVAVCDGQGVTAEQFVAMASLCRCALEINRQATLEFVGGLWPFVEEASPPLPDPNQPRLPLS